MRAHYLGFCVLLTACASTAPSPALPPAPAPAPAPAAVTPQPTKAPAVAAVAPPATGVMSFDDWRQSFINKAVAKGFDPIFVTNVMAGVQPLPSVTSADSQQPEFSKPLSTYIRNTVTPARAAAARAALDADPDVATIVQTYGVPAEILGGIWTIESDLGRVQGSTDVVAALSTLAYNGRRRDWAEGQLLAVLTILQQGKIDRAMLKGSWAGAMGQTQFEPDNYLSLGVDGDHDGKIDIWNSNSDALASAANLLAKAGWKPGEEWAVEVILPVGFDDYLAETQQMTPTQWAAMGVKRADNGYWKPGEADEEATLLLPSGAKGPAFLALPNHYVIRKYNNSTAYALAVGLLADGIAGRPPLVTPWPDEPPLSLDQREKSQMALKAAGFDPGPIDGVIGTGTRQAIREWQRANHLAADGYLSFDLANRFTSMVDTAGATTPVS
ncbi:lytic murein transglycosylase [Asticcacaulis sp. EMRT-3]|uniref:lytic murein transglycosylase n=1 Tax=Asticcacaulis sp. EMRT-3 TaxID=3040349 RepID=UPI0024AE96CF|nr:lytic murein transglycosylase [Asticcacaulis sp. EMRT-3]MDI7774286.1 lytic murein transglycosylase [Asticcacaulis sp. EMRT-3]